MTTEPEAGRTATPDTRTALDIIADAIGDYEAAEAVVNALAAAGARVVYGDVPNGCSLERSQKPHQVTGRYAYWVREEPTDG